MNRAQRRALKREGTAAIPVERGAAVTLAYLCPGDVSALFHESCRRLREYELFRTFAAMNGQPYDNVPVSGLQLGSLSRRAGSGGIADARNYLTREFLASESEFLLCADADMGFPAWSLHAMLGAALNDGLKPIIGGLCFALSTVGYNEENQAETRELFPTIGIWDRNEAGEIIGFKYVMQWEKGSVIQMDMTGAAFLLIHRSVFEAMGDGGWWTQIDAPEGAKDRDCVPRFSEDVSFFIRAAQHGFKPWLHTGVTTAHDKGGAHLDEAMWDFQQEIKAAAAILNNEKAPAPLERPGTSPIPK